MSAYVYTKNKYGMQVRTVKSDLWTQLSSISLNKYDLILKKQQHPSYWSFLIIYANYVCVYLFCLSIKFYVIKYVLLVPKIKR